MALNPKLSNVGANAAANATCALLNSGYLRIYDGTQPADADTAVTTQTLLAELRYNATAFNSASGGAANANALTPDASANSSGTATWFRALESDGVTVVFDGSVGTSNANLVMNSVAITAGSTVSISSHTYTQQKS